MEYASLLVALTLSPQNKDRLCLTNLLTAMVTTSYQLTSKFRVTKMRILSQNQNESIT